MYTHVELTRYFKITVQLLIGKIIHFPDIL